MNRRMFLGAATAGVAGLAVPLLGERQHSPVQVYDGSKWATRANGMLDVKKGDVFRIFHPSPEFPGELHPTMVGGIGIALEDGHFIRDDLGAPCGGCEADFYDTLEGALGGAASLCDDHCWAGTGGCPHCAKAEEGR